MKIAIFCDDGFSQRFTIGPMTTSLDLRRDVCNLRRTMNLFTLAPDDCLLATREDVSSILSGDSLVAEHVIFEDGDEGALSLLGFRKKIADITEMYTKIRSNTHSNKSIDGATYDVTDIIESVVSRSREYFSEVDVLFSRNMRITPESDDNIEILTAAKGKRLVLLHILSSIVTLLLQMHSSERISGRCCDFCRMLLAQCMRVAACTVPTKPLRMALQRVWSRRITAATATAAAIRKEDTLTTQYLLSPLPQPARSRTLAVHTALLVLLHRSVPIMLPTPH